MGFASPIPKRGCRRKVDPYSVVVSQPPSQHPLRTPNNSPGIEYPMGPRLKTLFISKKGAGTVSSTTGLETTSQSSSQTEPRIGLESQETPAKDALLHLLLRENMKTQYTGAVTTLARIVLHATALTSPSSISRHPISSAATPVVESVSSAGREIELGSSVKNPELGYDNEVKSAINKAHGSPSPSMQESEAATSSYVTPTKPRKRTLSLPSSTPSRENIKRSQMVGDDCSRRKGDTLDRTSVDTASEAISVSDIAALKAKLEYNKNVEEEQAQTPEGDNKKTMLCSTRDRENLTTKTDRNSRAQELQQDLEGRALKAEKQLKLTENRLQFVESELDALRARDPSAGVASQHEETPVPQDHQTQTRLPLTEDTSLATVVRERDQIKQDNETLLEKNTSLQADNLAYRRLYEQSEIKLTDMRHELETEPTKFAETDGLLQGKADRYNDLMREHNEVIGHNTQLRGEMQDLKLQKQEELASKETELNEYRASERYLSESRDKHILFASRIVGWLRHKMTASDVDYMTDCAWLVTKKDCKILAEKVVWLRKALRSCNKARLATNNESRIMRRIYDARIQENEELLEYRTDSKVQIEALQHQLKDHVPVCKTVIAEIRAEVAEQHAEIAALNECLEVQDKKHKAQIAKGASYAMQDILEGNQHMITDLLDRGKKQGEEIEDLKAQLKGYSIYVSDEEGRLHDYVDRMESFKVRAYAAEGEVSNLRKQLDTADENLADPRKWEHHQTCSEWRAQAKVVVEEHQQKRDLTVRIIEGLWERMRDFESSFRCHGMPDPDTYLKHSEPRRDNLRKWIGDLLLYNIDAHVQRRKEVDEQELPSQAYSEEDEDEDFSSDDSDDEDESEDESESSREDGQKGMNGAGNSSEHDQQADPQGFAIYDEEGFLQTNDPERKAADGEVDWDTTQGTVDNAVQERDTTAQQPEQIDTSTPPDDEESSRVLDESCNEMDSFEDSEIIR